MQKHQVVIVGAGLAALCTAARLYELGKRDIVLYARAYGGTPYIAAINFVTEDNPFGDTAEQYANDMLEAGHHINNAQLVQQMCQSSTEGYELLKRWDVNFAHEKDGSLKRRHASGSTCPRSLCSTTKLIGEEIIQKLTTALAEKGIALMRGNTCVQVLVENGTAKGITVKNDAGQLGNVYADVVVAAWGGVGNLFGTSTYPEDINGHTLAIAAQTGAKLVDMEFLEYEPLVVLSPEAAKREPCPTAMLGEGAHLLNSAGERFILKLRPQGEAGSPKTLLNRAIWQEVEQGRGTVHHGVFADLRHIPESTLKAYPWFYNRLMDAEVNLAESVIEVGPMAHSYSGGLLIDENYCSTVEGLYAVGEAAGSLHGACRLAGNAAAQATLSGLLCAQAVAKILPNIPTRTVPEAIPITYVHDAKVNATFVPKVQALAQQALGNYRTEESLMVAKESLRQTLADPELHKDTEALHQVLAVLLMVTAAEARKESRGTHMRKDYPDASPTFTHAITIWQSEDLVIHTEIK